MMQSLKKKRKKELARPCVNMLQYSNEEITFCLWQRYLKIQCPETQPPLE